MNTNHTHGPWREAAMSQTEVRLFTEGGRFICRIEGVDLSKTEDQSNARLIAAAPEMLHALKLAAEELNKMGCECDCEASPVHCPVCAVNAAIAKALNEP